MERLELDNGLLLCPNHDWLFDKGYIYFSNNGQILITEPLNELTKTFMNISGMMKFNMNERQKIYMEWYRGNVLKINEPQYTSVIQKVFLMSF